MNEPHSITRGQPIQIVAPVRRGLISEIIVRPNFGLHYIFGVRSTTAPNLISILQVSTGDFPVNRFTYDASAFQAQSIFACPVDWGVISNAQPLEILARTTTFADLKGQNHPVVHVDGGDPILMWSIFTEMGDSPDPRDSAAQQIPIGHTTEVSTLAMMDDKAACVRHRVKKLESEPKHLDS